MVEEENMKRTFEIANKIVLTNYIKKKKIK